MSPTHAVCRRPIGPRRPHGRRGISALDVLIALVAVRLLLALAWPLILSARESARQTTCRNHLRQLTTALAAYHDAHGVLPPAAVWSTSELRSLALHQSQRGDLFIQANWAQMLLPFAGEEELARQFDPDLPVAAPEHERPRTTRMPLMTCPSDEYNRPDNPHVFEPTPRNSVTFARGNYALNGGTHGFDPEPGSTAFVVGEGAHLVMGGATREFCLWGNGIAGFNVSFSLDDFTNGTASLIALEEIRAGIHRLDPRGVWSLGQVGGSITWAHGVNGDAYGPNNAWSRSDDIQGCGRLHEVVGTQALEAAGMPCVHYSDLNYQATARSQHAGGVHVAFLDGSVRFLSDEIDPGLWHVLHSRETPPDVLTGDLADGFTLRNVFEEATAGHNAAAIPEAEPLSLLENSLGMPVVLLPAGEFMMGLPDTGNDHDLPAEAPAHPVRITRPFYLGRTEVTQEQYAQVMGENPSYHAPETTDGTDTDRFPVEQVTWHQAEEFCRRLSSLPEERRAGRRYRLPSEAEWEYACRAGRRDPYAWSRTRAPGDRSGDTAGILPELPLGPVASYPPNEFGLYDMRGNVWEWCADWFDRDYYSRSPADDPRGPARGYLKVVRGSDWIFVGEGCKINYPIMPPWKANRFVGFRVVCELTAPARPTPETAHAQATSSGADRPQPE